MRNVFSFVGASGSGKTTFIERLITLLSNKGYKIGAIKHDAHRFEIDKPGKDSYRFKAAGAVVSLISSGEKHALVRSHIDGEIDIKDIILKYMNGMDLIITEGYKKSDIPKIEVLRKGNGNLPVAFGSEYLIGVVTDYSYDEICELLKQFNSKDPKTISCFTLDDVEKVAEFILSQTGLSSFNIEVDCSNEVISRGVKDLLEPLKFFDNIKNIEIRIR